MFGILTNKLKLMSTSNGKANKTNKELEKSFVLAVKLFKQGDFEQSRQEFESILRNTTDEEKKGFLTKFFTEPSLRVKSENYVKKIIQKQAQAEAKRKKKEKEQSKKEEKKEKIKVKEAKQPVMETVVADSEKISKEPKAVKTEEKKQDKKETVKLAETKQPVRADSKKISEKFSSVKTEEKKQEEQLPPVKSSRIGKKLKAMTRHPLIVGVDISDHSIEVLQLDIEKNVQACARSVLEKGIVESAEIKNKERLGEVFQETLKKAGLDYLMQKKKSRIKGLFSLPESKVFIREFSFEERENLQAQLKEKIKANIPVSSDELCWDYLELGDQLKGARLLVVAVQSKVIEEYLHFFWDQGVDPVVFDMEAASVARALLPPEEQKGSTVIIDLGARTSIINIFDPKKDLNLSVSVFCAGNYFNQKIAEKMGITEAEAEKLKEESGFNKEPVGPILKECSFALIKEIQDALKYHRDRFGFKSDKIILTGGSALLPGIKDHFQENFKEKIEIGNSLQNINPGSFFKDEKEAMLFANVIGLAIRGLYQDFIDEGINLLTDNIKRREKVLQRERERFFLYVAAYFLAVLIGLAAVIFIFYLLGIIRLEI